ncbi:MAG: S8 family serine peptidase [Desulfobulbaceae bacterium]|uniref:S8 family serine peptidase n=1 Tax=Candidatus Desulfatifera sulfidica TaxID=2841691 RepID=A0A8J6N9G6_9BACT|nr:S8 family serine peptidase [Candidatus Desulfatifera sulfidica]
MVRSDMSGIESTVELIQGLMKCGGRLALCGLLCGVIVSTGACSGGGGVDASTDADPISSTYTISGHVSVSPVYAMDSDVNDPNAPYASNDTLLTAQLLPNPVVVGGYVNEHRSGAPGRSRIIGDPADFYSVSLTENQILSLSVAESQTADLDLYLYTSEGTMVDGSLGTGAIETIVVPADGSYCVEVRVYSSSSNYTLAVGQQSSFVSVDHQRLILSAEFAPGQVVSRFRQEKTETEVSASSMIMAHLGMTPVAGASHRGMLLRFEPDFVLLSAQHQDAGILLLPECATWADEGQRLRYVTLLRIKELRLQEGVELAEPNYLLKSSVVPNDSYYHYQWNYPLVHLDQAWEVTTGNSQVVAVVDTGVILTHPDLQGQLVPGYDFISDPSMALDGDGIDSNPDDPGDQSTGGSSFHGTHVAGIVAASTNNGQGVAGSGYRTQVMPLRVLGQGGVGTSYDVMQAVRYAAGLSNDSGRVPTMPVTVINLSLGGGSYSQEMQNLISDVRAAGVIVVAAAGNEGLSTVNYPAAYAGVVGVSAVDGRGELTPYSNHGSEIDLAAPGGDITSDVNGDGYGDGILSTGADDSSGTIQPTYVFMQGTSMAVPHVSGVAALMKSVWPELSPAGFDLLLQGGWLATDLGDPGHDSLYGYGLIDARQAVLTAQNQAGGSVILPAVMTVSPVALNFGETVGTVVLQVGNGGTESLVMNGFSEDAPWLTVTEQNVNDDSRLGTYLVSVNRSGLDIATYSATITFFSSSNSVEVPVIMSVRDDIHTGDAGHHYVLLLDAETLDILDQVEADAMAGEYQYSFTEVPAGQYKIFAGTDSDNDFFLGDAGEASGAYPTLTALSTVAVEDNVTNLHFNTGFKTEISSFSLSVQDFPGLFFRSPVLRELSR